ncbi:MAG: hypothetical protein H3C34_22110, partial [Caldilineaceae bacterium]|nr:hypothetical protein [Caldilineaceae bacterium]
MARFATTFPAPNQVLWKQSTGGTLAITVSGVAQRDQSIFNATQEIETAVTGISVQLGSAFPVEATVVDGRNQKSWSATLYAPAGVGQTISVTAAIMHTISDRRTGDLISSSTSTETETLLISVQEDSEAPKVELISGPVPLPGAVFGVGIGVKLSDSGSGLQSFAWSLDGSAFTPLAIGNEREFELTVQVPLASRTGAYEWIGRASDQVGYVTDLRLTLQDNSVPELEITYPQNNVKVPHDGRSGRIILKGTVKDPWSGVSRVEWSVDGGAFTPVLTGDGWANWTAPVVFGPNDAGRFHRVTVRAVDNLNLSIEKQLDLEVARPYQPREAKDLVSSRAYLQDLLEFSETHARTRPNDTALRPSDLNQTFYQPFDRLAEPLPITDLGNRPVNQVRLAIEVLRQYLRSVPSGLVAHWTFDEGSGPRAADATGNGHHGYVHNTSWTMGRTGGALQFDGVSSFVEVANPAALVHDSAQKESAKALSISVWIYPTGSGSGANGEGGILVNKEGEFEVARFSDGTIRWAFANVDPGWKWIDTTAIAPLNTWSHVAVTFDNGTVTTYLNGSPAHVYPGSGVISTVAPGISDLRLGARQHTSQHFHGLLEDVRIYRLAIDAAAVAALAGIVKLPALLAHWPCDELGGTVLGDITPNRSQGTLLDGATLSYVNGRQAVTFDGAQGRVEIPNTSFLEVGMQGADFSVAFWLYLREGATGKWRAIVHKGDQNTERTFALWMRPDDNRVHYRISTDEDWNEGGDSV